jgi:hypothetical protein
MKGRIDAGGEANDVVPSSASFDLCSSAAMEAASAAAAAVVVVVVVVVVAAVGPDATAVAVVVATAVTSSSSAAGAFFVPKRLWGRSVKNDIVYAIKLQHTTHNTQHIS